MKIYKSIESVIGLREIVDSLLEKHSIVLPESSRFHFYRDVFDNQYKNQYKDLFQLCKANNLSLDYLPFIYKEYYDFLYTLSKMLVLYESLGDLREKQTLLKKIKVTFKGASFIEKEGEKNAFSEPRDTLFELTVASQFYEIGLADIKFLEHPDVLVTNNGIKFGFECKRVRYYEKNNFIKRIESAVDQICDYKQFHDIGIIAIDVSYLVTDGGKMNMDINFEEFQKRSMALMKDLCDEVERKSNIFVKATRQSKVFGIILFSSGLVQFTNDFNAYANNYMRSYESINKTAGELFYNSFRNVIEKNPIITI